MAAHLFLVLSFTTIIQSGDASLTMEDKCVLYYEGICDFQTKLQSNSLCYGPTIQNKCKGMKEKYYKNRNF